MVAFRLVALDNYRPIDAALCTFHRSDLSLSDHKARFDATMQVRGDRVEQFLLVARANGYELTGDGAGLGEFGAFLASAFEPDYWEMADLDHAQYSFVVDASLHLGSVVHAELPATKWAVAPKGRVGEGQHALIGFASRRHDPYSPLWLVNSFLMRVARSGEKQSVQLPQGVVKVTVPPAPLDEFVTQLERLREPG